MTQEPEHQVDPLPKPPQQPEQAEPVVTFSDDQILTLSTSAAAFGVCPAAALRRQLSVGFFVVCAAVAVAALSLSYPTVATGAVGLALLTLLWYFLITGLAGKSYLCARAARFLLGGGVFDWLIALLALGVAISVLAVFGSPQLWLGVAMAALGCALSMQLVLERQLATQRQPPIRQAEGLLKDLRRHGASDEDVRRFVCQHGGTEWEPFFEALFGYEAKIVARGRWGPDELGRPRPKHLALRDEIVLWMDRRRRRPPEAPPAMVDPAPHAQPAPATDQTGVSDASAAAPTDGQAHPDAAAAAAAAAAQTQTPMRPTSTSPTDGTRPAKWPGVPDVAESAQSQRGSRGGLWGPEPRGPLAALLGARLRFVIGALLLGACVLWIQQNDRSPLDDLRKLQEPTGDQADGDKADVVEPSAEETAADAVAASQPAADPLTQPLQLPWLPGSAAEWVARHEVLRWFDHYGVGVAGLILIFSAFFRGIKIAVFIYPAAAAAMFGHRWGIPPVAIFSEQHMGMAAGLGLMVLGALFGRVRE